MMTSEMQNVFMVVQEAPGEAPAIASVPALSGEAALARVPAMAKDFFGSVPEKLRTWRIEREELSARWVIYACEWSSQDGEVTTALSGVPTNVLVLLMRYAGSNDGVQNALDSSRMLVDIDGAEKQFEKEFRGGMSDEVYALAKHIYARAWTEGIADALNAKYQQRLTSNRKGRT
jgi:hypothetical protein